MCHVPERENRCHPFKVALLIVRSLVSDPLSTKVVVRVIHYQVNIDDDRTIQKFHAAPRRIETSKNGGETWESAQNFNTRH
jgi:hypothetical protein